MNLFQWLIVPALVLLVIRDGYLLLASRPRFRRDRMIRVTVWLLATLAVLQPNTTTMMANMVGIQRGTDLVLYAFVLAFLATTFTFYARFIKTDRQLTEIVRHLAIVEARRVTPSEGSRT